ncbi:MAG: glycosyltransferase [Candidatus Magasanikbacteria bacterium]
MIKKRKIEREVNKKDFFRYISESQKKKIEKFSKNLEDKKIVHFNATPRGGGVAELLESLIPYLRSLGVDAEWYSIDSSEVDISFFEITDKLRDALQSNRVPLSEEEWKKYTSVNKGLGAELSKIEADLFVIHDWQVLYSGTLIDDTKKIYINHPDTSDPFEEVWSKVLDMIMDYDLHIFSNPTFIHGDFKGNDRTRVITKAIDPLKEKQKVVPQSQARDHLKTYGIPEERPLIVQVSRFDPWKNPKGVIEAFQKIQPEKPQAHLSMVGLQEAEDNPEAEEVFNEVQKMVESSDRISLFFDPQKNGIENISKFTMYMQNAADIIIQNSIKEGFGLTISEALWKKKPVIGGPASGVKLQIKDGWNGYIVQNRNELADKIQELLASDQKRREMGENGRKYVKENFLFSRFLKDHLNSYNELIG